MNPSSYKQSPSGFLVALFLLLECCNRSTIHSFQLSTPLLSSSSTNAHSGNLGHPDGVCTPSSLVSTMSRNNRVSSRSFPKVVLHSKTDDEDDEDDDDAWDSPEDYADSKSTTTSTSTTTKTPESFGNQPSLGINIGSQLQPLSPSEAESLKSEATSKINAAFDARLSEIQSMKESIRADFEQSKRNLQYQSDLRAREETEKLMKKIDQMSDEFLKDNEALRMGTKYSALADKRNAEMGKGLEIGSWGDVNGMDVGMGMGLVLGSVGSKTKKSTKKKGTDTKSGFLGSSFDMMEEEEEDEDEYMEEDEDIDNRIIVIADEKQVS